MRAKRALQNSLIERKRDLILRHTHAQLLNDEYVSIADSKDAFLHMRRTQYEIAMFVCEDDRCAFISLPSLSVSASLSLSVLYLSMSRSRSLPVYASLSACLSVCLSACPCHLSLRQTRIPCTSSPTRPLPVTVTASALRTRYELDMLIEATLSTVRCIHQQLEVRALFTCVYASFPVSLVCLRNRPGLCLCECARSLTVS